MPWQLLIATVPSRHEKLCGLLAELDRQYRPGLEVLLYRDNVTVPVGAKRQALLDASVARYVCFLDDDDWVAPGYVPQVLAGIAEGPDYVGFRVRLVVDGDDASIYIAHSLRYPGWRSDNTGIYRDISHLNPIRRELALAGRFGGGYGEDARWADDVRASGRARTEAWLPDALYWYRYSNADNSCGRSLSPVPDGAIRPLPAYPWLRVVQTLESC